MIHFTFSFIEVKYVVLNIKKCRKVENVILFFSGNHLVYFSVFFPMLIFILLCLYHICNFSFFPNLK